MSRYESYETRGWPPIGSLWAFERAVVDALIGVLKKPAPTPEEIENAVINNLSGRWLSPLQVRDSMNQFADDRLGSKLFLTASTRSKPVLNPRARAVLLAELEKQRTWLENHGNIPVTARVVYVLRGTVERVGARFQDKA